MKNVVIIGAGPSGLTAAYELVTQSDEFHVIVLEESTEYGGISRTVNYNGNRMDMGGHRFFSKVEEVNAFWDEIMSTQGVVPLDDKMLGRVSKTVAGGPDPDERDDVMLWRNRVSRILFNGKFFDYPVTLSFGTLKNMGFLTTMEVGFSYLKSCIIKRPEKSLEDFYINRFGKKLYSMFFERYTENLWGRHPSKISPEWGAQRVKGLSISAILADIFRKMLPGKSKKVETSLISEFMYPKFGPGQMWTLVAQEAIDFGAEVHLDSKVKEVLWKDGKVTGVIAEGVGGDVTYDADYVISSMPVKDLIGGMKGVPQTVAAVAEGLPYRDYITVGVLVDKLLLKNETKIKTLGGIIPDNWVYIHDRSVQMGRMQVFNNWSPYMVKDPEHTVWVGLEYFCNEGDVLWEMPDAALARTAVREMVTLGMISGTGDVIDTHVERVKKAYPAYFDTYEQFGVVREFLDTIPNLFCVGRNGQHRYNNMDHSMCTAFETVKNLLEGREDRSNIWDVNTEKEYHEAKA